MTRSPASNPRPQPPQPNTPSRFPFYSSLQMEHQYWPITGAPDFPTQLCDYFQKKGPVFRGDYQWHSQFWQSTSLFNDQPFQALCYCALLFMIPGAKREAKQVVVDLLDYPATALLLVEPDIGSHICQFLKTTLSEWQSIWTLPQDQNKICWSPNAFNDPAVAQTQNSFFLSQLIQSAEVFSQVSPLSSLPGQLFEQSLKTLSEGTSPAPSPFPFWALIFERCELPLTHSQDCLEHSAQYTCTYGGARLNQSFFSLFSTNPQVHSLFFKACCTQLKNLSEHLLPRAAPHPFELSYNENGQITKLVAHIQKQYFENPEDFFQRPEFPSIVHHLSALQSYNANAFKFFLKIIASSLTIQPSYRHTLPDSVWLQAACAHANNPSCINRERFMRATLPEHLQACPDMLRALSKLSPQQGALLDHEALNEVVRLVLMDPLESDEAPPVQKNKLRL